MDIGNRTCEVMVAVLLDGVAIVPLVGDGERPVRVDGILQQSEGPIATLLVILLLALFHLIALVNFVFP